MIRFLNATIPKMSIIYEWNWIIKTHSNLFLSFFWPLTSSVKYPVAIGAKTPGIVPNVLVIPRMNPAYLQDKKILQIFFSTQRKSKRGRRHARNYNTIWCNKEYRTKCMGISQCSNQLKDANITISCSHLNSLEA